MRKKQLKLYEIEQDDVCWDEFEGAVVAAFSKQDAKTIHPNGKGTSVGDGVFGSWVLAIEDVNVLYLGIAGSKIKHGVICSNFRAG